MTNNDYPTPEVDGDINAQWTLFDLDAHSAGQVGVLESEGESSKPKLTDPNDISEFELHPNQPFNDPAAQAEDWVNHIAVENKGDHMHASDGQATQGKTASAEDGPCPYRARLTQAIQDFGLQSANLPASRRALITASSRADFHQTHHEAWDAVSRHLGSQNTPSIFQRGGRAVYMQRELAAHTTHLAIRPHTPDTMNAETSRAIYWYDGWTTVPVATGGLTPLSGADLDAVAAAIEAADVRPHAHVVYTPPGESRGEATAEVWDIVYPVPHYPNRTVTRSMAAALPDNVALLPLETIIDKPVLSREGRHLLIHRGYHRAEGIFLNWDGTGELPPVEECVKRLDELFGVYAEDPLARPGFPFDSPASRAHLYACLLAGVIGPAVPKKPFFLFDKATPRTGATLMAETVSVILTGDLPTCAGAAGKETATVDEMVKGLTAAAANSRGVILMDNVTGVLDHPEWNRYATQEVWESRRLGTSDQTVRVSRRTITDILTANNLRLTTESAGRVCISRLDAAMEHPEERRFTFSPQEWASNRRRYYVEAVVGLVAHWLNTGSVVERGLNRWGGFDEWRDMTGGILKAAGIGGFGEPVGLAMSDRIHDGGEKALVRWWWENHGLNAVGTKELSAPAVVGDDQNGEPGILTDLRGQNSRARATSLGKFIVTLIGRTYSLDSGESLVIRPAGSSNNRALHKLELRR